jgi:hypothetical protein
MRLEFKERPRKVDLEVKNVPLPGLHSALMQFCDKAFYSSEKKKDWFLSFD